MYLLCFDGLFRGLPGTASDQSNSGFMCYGWVITRDGTLVARGHGVAGRNRHATSNVAEFIALVEGLEALRDMGVRGDPVTIQGDAKSIIDQMLGLAEVRSDHIKPFYRKARKLAGYFQDLCWHWVPRRHNRSADLLTRLALRQMRASPDAYQAAIHAIGSSGKRLKAPLHLLDSWVFQPTQ